MARRGWQWKREPGPLQQKPTHWRVPRRRLWRQKATQQTPFLNPDPFQHWHGIKNIAKVKTNGESCMTLLDNGTKINTITPKYISDHSLHMGPITNLLGAKVACMELGNTYTRPLCYIVIWVQVESSRLRWRPDSPSNPDLSNFAAQIPVILGTPTISRVINVMQEGEIDALAMPWANVRVAHLLSVHRMMAMEVGDGIARWVQFRQLWPGTVHPK